MKKLILAALVVAVMASGAFAGPDKFKIYTEKKGLMGWGRTIIMVNTESGATWSFNGKNWEPISRTEEMGSDEAAVKVQEMINIENARKIDELKAQLAKKDKELKLMQKLKTKKNVRKPVKHWKKKTIVAPKVEEEEEDLENQAPGWMNK